jgi:hypothetical protein
MSEINKFEEKIFWKDGFNGECKGGIHFRAFDLNKFIKKVEVSEQDVEVVGIKFKGNNLELIIKK